MRKELSVELISYTPNPEIVVGKMAAICYSPEGLNKEMDIETARHLIKKIRKKHQSVLEHVSWSFYIEGISRACSHELVRHRIASFSQRSQRYVSEEDFDYCLPKEIIEAIGEKRINEHLKLVREIYSEIVEQYKKNGKNPVEARQDARYFLPNATETKIGMTMNARSLANFFNLRLCNRAQEEIRDVAGRMFELAYPTAPSIFEWFGPDCYNDRCKEGKESCGLSQEVYKEMRRLRGL